MRNLSYNSNCHARSRSVVGTQSSLASLAAALLFQTSTVALAQQVLPQPEATFSGVIRTLAADSVQSFPRPPAAPKGAPNVIIILLDDVGYGQMGTFGSPIPTPALDALAKDGLRFTQLNTTAICSPTRASLLTGRNHHNVGFGIIENFSAGFPGYNNVWPRSAASIGAILKGNGYATSWFGKNHNTPDSESGPTGPFDRWPSGLGFDYFYGFHGGETDQWRPSLFENTQPVEVPADQKGIHFTTLMTNKAIEWLRRERSVTPDKPFLMYFAPGATHAPHQVAKEWAEKFKGKFDSGWDAYREETFRRQKKLGVLPAHAKLTPRPDEIPAWSSLTSDQKLLYSRMMENFAGFTAQTDYEIRRLIEELKRTGTYENTLIFYIAGDNGGSSEGGLSGTFNSMVFGNKLTETIPQMISKLDRLGTEDTHPMLPAGWAWASDTPYRWTKTVASHFGGIRNGMVVTWPKRIAEKGGVRDQFHHVNDVVPTILEAIGLPAPKSVDGVDQKPMDGVSMTYTFDKIRRDAPTHKQTQYFEIMGNRGLFHQGWFAASRDGVPWRKVPSKDLDKVPWELYDLSRDPTQANDLAAKNPAKLEEMKALWWSEAQRNNVLPLDNRFIERTFNPQRPSPTAGRTHFTYYAGVTRISNGSAPDLKNKDFTITADVETGLNANGVLVTQGGQFAGWSFFMDAGRLTFGYNLAGQTIYRIQSESTIAPGSHRLSVEFAYDGGGMGKGGAIVLKDGDVVIGRGRLEKTLPLTFEVTEGLDIGQDHGTAAVPDYRQRMPFQFNGTINRVDFTLPDVKAKKNP